MGYPPDRLQGLIVAPIRLLLISRFQGIQLASQILNVPILQFPYGLGRIGRTGLVFSTHITSTVLLSCSIHSFNSPPVHSGGRIPRSNENYCKPQSPLLPCLRKGKQFQLLMKRFSCLGCTYSPDVATLDSCFPFGTRLVDPKWMVNVLPLPTWLDTLME